MKIVLSLLLLISVISCGQEPNNTHSKHKYTNQLVNETSPYLLQHAHNPVNWYPWGPKALEKAKEEDKLIIISVGYSACHWCHVMEHESFEDEEVAKYMNANFIAIKVDREERPDVDQVYMNAVQLLTGSGGWPLNVIALPDGRPLYGGTYFPKKDWLSMLTQISKVVKESPEKAEQQAQSLTDGVKSSELNYITPDTANPNFKLEDLNTVFTNWKQRIDYTHGGGNRAPKFPMPVGYQFLLHYNFITQNTDALKAVNITLNKMADGGIYDQVGGGFARYSTDALWKVPHFEKMVYDNSQLVSLYASAYQATKNPYYKTIVYETLEFIHRELTSKDGAFYSSLDADSDGEEGKFYVWKKSELQTILGDDTELISDYYNVTEKGNWEHGNNILFKTISDEDIAKKHKISLEELQSKVSNAKTVLLKARSKRIRPGLDDKIITAWNSLMLKGYVDAYRVFGDQQFLDAALKNAKFLIQNIQKSDHRLDRNFKNGVSNINGFLDDYAFTIDAFIGLYQATFDEKWLLEAQELAKYTMTHFYDTESNLFFYTSDLDPSLIARKKDIPDNVIPSANSQMAKNLFVLGQYFYNDDYVNTSKKMLMSVKPQALKGGVYYGNWDVLMAWFVSEPYEVAILGDDYANKRKEFGNYYLPNVFLSGGKDEGNLELHQQKYIANQTTIYACKNKLCKLPSTQVNTVVKQVTE